MEEKLRTEMMEERKERDVESEVCEIAPPPPPPPPPMETPERKQIGAPVPKFEDSPVFNYINNLSPLDTVRPRRISQTFNSFNFGSMPSIFSSPHAHSLRESLFLKRHQLPDSSKPELPSEKGNAVDSSDGVIFTHGISNGQNESSNPVNFVSEASTKPNTECTNLSVGISKSTNYECSSPNCSSTPRGHQIGSGLEMAIVPFAQEMSDRDVCAKDKQEHVQHIKEVGCDWNSLTSDASDLLIFDSPDGTQTINTPFLKSLNSCAKVVNSENDHMNMNDVVSSDAVPHNEMEIPSHEEEDHLKETDASENRSMPTNQNDSDAMSQLHFGIRRRCLVFEMSGARMRSLGGASTSGSSLITQQDANTETKDNKELVPARSGNDSSHCILNGIGLHLNALARITKDYNEVTPENLASGRQLIVDRSSIGTFPSLTSNQELDLSLAVAVSEERNIESADNGVLVAQDASQASMYIAGEELSQNSPKKKRRRSESGEIEGCRRCNCKKSKCLKLYCECFAAGVYCVEPCSCLECFNKPIHEDTVLATRKQIESRNPMAFAPKVISSSDIIGDESSVTPASARHKRGCNCKKSGCLKKYCECYQGGVGCSINCRCEGCKNAFGRKDGSTLIAPEAVEMEENDTEATAAEKKTIDKTPVINNGKNVIDAFPATPLMGLRSYMEEPFSSKSRLRSSVLTIGGLNGRPSLGKTNFLPPTQPKLATKKRQREDEIPEILKVGSDKNNRSPGSSGIKSSSSSSPNSKRVSPPDCGTRSSPGMRSRKLILQSIPSFPALTPPKH